MFNPFKNRPIQDMSAVVITGGTVSPTTFMLPEGTPTNAVVATKVLTVGTNPVESATVSVGATTYRFRAVIGAGTKAEQTLTFNAELPHDGDTVILGSTTYTFKTALTPTAGEVLIDVDVTTTIDNLVAAVDGGAGAGTKYATGTPDIGAVVTPTKPTADTFKVVYYVEGTLGNSFDTLGTLTHAVWGNTTLLGGVNPQAANDVLIGADVSGSLDNLVLAINAGSGIGVQYGTGTVVNGYVTAAKTTAATMTVTNKVKGVIGNLTAIAEGLADGSWAGGATFLSGGVDGTVGAANETCADANFIYHCPVANTIADAYWKKIPLNSPATELTIASGSITPTSTIHTVDTEGGAASDDLTTIAAGWENQLLIIRADNAARTVVVKNATGNILSGGSDINLDDTNKYLLFVYDSILAMWVVIGGSADLSSPGTIGGTAPGLIYFKKGADIASATPALSAATGNIVDITGTTTITSFGTVNAGAIFWLKFTGALTLTYNVTSMILPGARDITTAAGDRACFVSLGSGNWYCQEFLKASGFAVGSLSTTIIIASGAVTRDLCFGGKIGNYNQANDVVIGPLPTAENGMNFIVAFGTAVAKYYRIDPANADLIYYEGVSTGAGKYVGVAATAIGQMMQFFTVQTGASAWAWVVNPNFSGLVQEA